MRRGLNSAVFVCFQARLTASASQELKEREGEEGEGEGDGGSRGQM